MPSSGNSTLSGWVIRTRSLTSHRLVWLSHLGLASPAGPGQATRVCRLRPRRARLLVLFAPARLALAAIGLLRGVAGHDRELVDAEPRQERPGPGAAGDQHPRGAPGADVRLLPRREEQLPGRPRRGREDARRLAGGAGRRAPESRLPGTCGAMA